MSQRGGREESSADGAKMKSPRIDKTKRETIGRKEDTVTRRNETKRNETKDWLQEKEEEEEEEGIKVPLARKREKEKKGKKRDRLLVPGSASRKRVGINELSWNDGKGTNLCQAPPPPPSPCSFAIVRGRKRKTAKRITEQ